MLSGQGAQAIRTAWTDAGRLGAPRLLVLAYFAMGEDAAKYTEGYLRSYYRDAGPFAEHIVRGAATDPGKLRGLVNAYTEAGCDDLLPLPCSPVDGQVELAAEALGLEG